MEKLDLYVTNNGDIEFIDGDLQMIEGRDIYVQCFRLLLGTWKGEYMLNTNEGLKQDAFLGLKANQFDQELAFEALQDVGEQVDDFVEYIDVNFNFNDETRQIEVDLVVQFADGFRQNLSEVIQIG